MGEDNLNLRSMQLYLFRMSPFPCCIFDNIEKVNVTKSRFLTFVSRYKRNAVEYSLILYVAIYFLEYNQWLLWTFKDVLNNAYSFFFQAQIVLTCPSLWMLYSYIRRRISMGQENKWLLSVYHIFSWMDLILYSVLRANG